MCLSNVHQPPIHKSPFRHPPHMKNKPKPAPKSKVGATSPAKAAPALPRAPLFERLDQWLGKRHYWVLGTLVLLWLAIRVSMFNTVANGPLYQMYKWPQSDNYFFDEWARTLAGGDWLNRQPLHPYHQWHDEFAGFYFKQHPDKLNQILNANPNRDSTFVAGKVLWNEWYGGNTFHQEPLYTYLLAALYAITGNGAYWMLALQCLLGILSGVLLWLTARRHFGDTVALLTGLLYLLCGIVLFQEGLLLRTAWSVFFAVLTLWAFDNALEKRTGKAFFFSGLTIGLACLLQSVFSLFLIGGLAFYWVQERKQPRLFARNAALAVAGCFLFFIPVILRNAVVGAPLFSSSSVGAVTFVASNVYQTNAVSRWAPEASKCAEIMGSTNGAFGPAAVAAIKTHPSAGSYVQLLWSKFQSVIHGLEWPNNENYYFYKDLVPALKVAFLNFFWMVWIGAAGILFALYYRKKYGSLYLAILLQVAVMLGFYVLGRFRTPLAALLLPFAAYGLVECFRFAEANWKESLGKIAVAALCFYFLTFRFYTPGLTMLDPTDYNVFYELVYYDKIKNNAEAKQWGQSIAAHSEFLRCQPDFVREAKANQLLKSPFDIEIMDQFANHYQIHSFLYEDSGNKDMAAKMMARRNLMKQIVENSRKYLNR